MVLETDNIMGDSKDRNAEDEDVVEDSSKTLKIRGTVLMGGLEIKRY